MRSVGKGGHRKTRAEWLVAAGIVIEKAEEFGRCVETQEHSAAEILRGDKWFPVRDGGPVDGPVGLCYNASRIAGKEPMNPFLIRSVVYPIYRRLKGDHVLAHLGEMRRVQVWEPERIRKFQWDKVKRLLKYSHRHVPYYREMFNRVGASPEDLKTWDDLRGLPILRKKNIRENTDAMISEIYPRNRLHPNSTGGSTGEFLHFYVDRNASEARRANNARMNEWIDIRIGDKMAMLWGTAFDVRRSNRMIKGLRNWFSNTLSLSAYTMGAERVDEYITRLKRFKPDLMIGYPSALTHFSESMARRVNGIRPRAVLVSGETLYEWQRGVIEEAFSAPVYNHYGCREFGALARECKIRNGLHIACERALVEEELVTDPESGEQVTELLITDLDNFGMPLIRYAIEDIGSVTWERCECGLGLPRLRSAVGRIFDVVRAPNGNFLGGTFWTILLRKVKGIERFQVIQDRLDHITIAVIPTEEFSGETRRYVEEKVAEACGPDMHVGFDFRERLEATPMGKHRFVISKIGLRRAGEEGRP
jgi:phenylacetate-CoA ligase